MQMRLSRLEFGYTVNLREWRRTPKASARKANSIVIARPATELTTKPIELFRGDAEKIALSISPRLVCSQSAGSLNGTRWSTAMRRATRPAAGRGLSSSRTRSHSRGRHNSRDSPRSLLLLIRAQLRRVLRPEPSRRPSHPSIRRHAIRRAKRHPSIRHHAIRHAKRRLAIRRRAPLLRAIHHRGNRGEQSPSRVRLSQKPAKLPPSRQTKMYVSLK